MELQKLVAGIRPDNDQKVSVKLQKNLKNETNIANIVKHCSLQKLNPGNTIELLINEGKQMNISPTNFILMNIFLHSSSLCK